MHGPLTKSIFWFCLAALTVLCLLKLPIHLSIIWLTETKIWQYTKIFHYTKDEMSYFSYNSIRDENERSGLDLDRPAGYGDSISCKFPILNPFDPSIQSYINRPSPISCEQVQPDLTYLDDNQGQIYLNQTALRPHWSCFWRPLALAEGDYNFEFQNFTWEPLSNPVKFPKYNAAEVSCLNQSNDEIYYNVHAYPNHISKSRREKLKPTNQKQLSVLLFVIDSVSNSMFKRSLPKLYHYLTKNLNASVYEFFNKVGDNTFPNMMAALTGLRGRKDQPNMKIEFPHVSGPYDHVPFIWNDFQAEGYLTGFLEDWADYGLFHYNKKGFQKPPKLDYYFRAYSLKILTQRYCFANKPLLQQQLDLLKTVLRNNPKIRKFFYYHFTDFSHGEDIAEVEKGDTLLTDFFQGSTKDSLLNDTIVIVMGDHGPRMGKFRSETTAGVFEERAPFVSIALPPWFAQLYPHIVSNMRKNQYRLAATFDLHETLKDILGSNYQGQQRNSTLRNLSLLYPLPQNRTCSSAGIPKHYCLCIHSSKLSPQDDLVKGAANFLVQSLNKRLETAYPGKCATLELKTIQRTEKLENSQESLETKLRSHEDTNDEDDKEENKETTKSPTPQILHVIRVQIQVKPSDAIFESTIQVIKADKDIAYESGSETMRLNLYRNQSHCIEDTQLKLYCFCNSQQ